MAEKELFGNSEQLDNISRAEAINAICEDGTQLERQGRYSMTMVERKQRDADILDALPSAQQWISCKTALPEKENTMAIIQTNAETVIIDGVYGGTDVYGHRVWRDKEGGLYWDDEIVAWMPVVIPEPWKGEE